jgi:carbamate kinase
VGWELFIIHSNGHLAGVEAVIDKDLTAGLLAHTIKASLLVILTSVDRVALDFQTSHPRRLSELSVEDARRYLAEGQFAPGSMGPKIEAAIHFLEGGSGQALITDAQHLRQALAHRAGTWIVPDSQAKRVKHSA